MKGIGTFTQAKFSLMGLISLAVDVEFQSITGKTIWTEKGWIYGFLGAAIHENPITLNGVWYGKEFAIN